MSVVEIPLLKNWSEPGPGWLKTVDSDKKPLKPLIKCQCGSITGIALHHVHPDGTVTASFYDINGEWEHKGVKRMGHGCGWHVFLKLLDYDLGDFPPEDI